MDGAAASGQERGVDSYPESLSGRAAAAAVAPDLNDNPERRRATYSADGRTRTDGRTTEARFEWGLRTHARALCPRHSLTSVPARMRGRHNKRGRGPGCTGSGLAEGGSRGKRRGGERG